MKLPTTIRIGNELFVRNAACPIRSHPYGGIPTGGGFSCSTEFEVGLQRLSEAVHCIIGSLHRSPKGSFHEGAHIMEEMDLVEKILAEYKRPIYVMQLEKRTLNDEYVARTFESLGKVGPSLSRKSQNAVKRLGDDLDPVIREVAEKAYQVLTVVGKSAVQATKLSKKNQFLNIMGQSELNDAIVELRQACNKYDAKFNKTKTAGTNWKYHVLFGDKFSLKQYNYLANVLKRNGLKIQADKLDTTVPAALIESVSSNSKAETIRKKFFGSWREFVGEWMTQEHGSDWATKPNIMPELPELELKR